MQQWEFMYVQVLTGSMHTAQEEADKLGALGWEPVGIASADKTLGFNANLLIFKRPIESPLPPPDTDDAWQDDPSGRFDKRKWNPDLRLWTAETAMMAKKTMHVDPPIRTARAADAAP
jgi:hypothetical protein